MKTMLKSSIEIFLAFPKIVHKIESFNTGKKSLLRSLQVIREAFGATPFFLLDHTPPMH